MNKKINNLSRLFGKKIKIERIKQDISQEQLAEKAQLHRTTLGQIENGKNSPTLDTISKIANALNLSISDLLSDL